MSEYKWHYIDLYDKKIEVCDNVMRIMKEYLEDMGSSSCDVTTILDFIKYIMKHRFDVFDEKSRNEMLAEVDLLKTIGK